VVALGSLSRVGGSRWLASRGRQRGKRQLGQDKAGQDRGQGVREAREKRRRSWRVGARVFEGQAGPQARMRAWGSSRKNGTCLRRWDQ
jgi:hypothetical protein